MTGKMTMRQQLQQLQALLDESTAIAEDLEEIIRQLRQVPRKNEYVFSTIPENFKYLDNLLGNDIGLVKGTYMLSGRVQTGVAYIHSIADKELISSQIIKPLLKGHIEAAVPLKSMPRLLQTTFLTASKIKQVHSLEQVAASLLQGNTALFVQGADTALIIGSRKASKRSIDKPENEGTVLASMESFIEDLDTNCSMVIKRLPIPSLRFEMHTVGMLSKTRLKLAWLEGIANTKVIAEARRRIQRIHIDNIDGIGVVAELMEDTPWSIFPQYRQTERPDVVAKSLTDGCFALLCSNSPFALVAPISLWDNFKTMDDYAERSSSASYLRLARYGAFLVSILVSPLYLAFVTYNQIIVPQALALAIATGREGVPFPTVVELLLMTIGITVIREASMRIPGSVGYFVGAIAAVVIGQATVAAGYVSASIIIIVAVSEISSFAVSTTTMVYTSRLINYFFIVLAGVFGMFGLINGVAIVLWHLSSLESFGVPYLYPLIPFDLEAMQDTFLRVGVLRKRLRILAPFNRRRRGDTGVYETKKQAGE